MYGATAAEQERWLDLDPTFSKSGCTQFILLRPPSKVKTIEVEAKESELVAARKAPRTGEKVKI